jgi:hypothetical protein
MRHARIHVLKRNLFVGLGLAAVWIGLDVWDRFLIRLPTHPMELQFVITGAAAVFALSNRVFAPKTPSFRRYLWLIAVSLGLVVIWFPLATLAVLWLHAATGGSL